jgi:hypothetical protein
MARIEGHGRDVDGAAPKHAHAELGVPSAEHGAYGMVREGSKEAQGLTEEQIRGVKPKPDDVPPRP